jgi:hypothetical protein
MLRRRHEIAISGFGQNEMYSAMITDLDQETLQSLKESLIRKEKKVLEDFFSEMTPRKFNPAQLVELGVMSKQAGFMDLAEKVLLHALASDEKHPAALYELAVIYRLSNRHHLAIANLLKAKAVVPTHFNIRLLLAHMLFAVGAHPEAVEICRGTTPNGPAEDEDLAVLREFGDYLREFPADRARYMVEEVHRRFRYLNAAQVAASIRSAIETRRPFSLVRLGDGEGIFAEIGAEDEAHYARLYANLRRGWHAGLYGAAFDPAATGYAAMVRTLMAVAGEADLVGVPYRSWVAHEYTISSIRGVPGLVNTHRHFLQHQDPAGPAICDQNIHTELHKQGLIEPILRMSRDIGVISCLSDLPERLKARFALDSVELFKIPGERYSQSLRSEEALSGVHFPFVYWNIVERLSRPHHGRVFLIAAGTLAKFYAAVIKRHGGIALDIGSLVDGWMRIASRPGYDSQLAL